MVTLSWVIRAVFEVERLCPHLKQVKESCPGEDRRWPLHVDAWDAGDPTKSSRSPVQWGQGWWSEKSEFGRLSW